jgi:FtsH-binding integral membrane protein
MLTFIVLGYVPGTHIQLSFSLLFVIPFAGLIAGIIYKIVHHVHTEKRAAELYFSIISL